MVDVARAVQYIVSTLYDSAIFIGNGNVSDLPWKIGTGLALVLGMVVVWYSKRALARFI